MFTQKNPILFAVCGDPKKAALIEYNTFLESGYIKPNRYERVLEYDRFEGTSEFFQLYDTRISEIIAVVRYITRKSPELCRSDFQTLSDFEIEERYLKMLREIDSDKLYEIGTISIVKKRRSIHTLMTLFQGIGNLHEERQYKTGLASMDRKLFYIFKNLVNRNLFNVKENKKVTVKKIGIEKIYMGSVTIPMMYTC